jgi:hypothetical protein
MKVLDFLFNICFAPFQKVKTNGRLAALIWLTPSLAFTLMGLLIWLTNLLLGVRIFSHITALTAGIISVLIATALYLLLDRIYLKGNRNTGEIRFTVLYILLLPILVIGSIVFFSLAIYKFG